MVFAEKSFSKGNFLMCYRGKLLDGSSGDIKEDEYKNEKLGSFIFYFEHVIEGKTTRLW